ncbi:hypothetical protein BDF22DRAFT_743043 [Syncephalis plumigaleata]|nr:hypothetical protein BDF22DRAFT_743043 [Syncephalis plumigaleata]
MRFSLASVSMCVLAVASTVLASPATELDFKVTNETLAAFNVNKYVQILPDFAFITPSKADPSKTVKEPDTERPKTIIFKTSYDECCGTEDLLADVKLDRALISGEVEEIKIKMPHDEKETITLERTLITGKYKELKVERNYGKVYSYKVEVPRTFFLGKPKGTSKTTIKSHL